MGRGPHEPRAQQHQPTFITGACVFDDRVGLQELKHSRIRRLHKEAVPLEHQLHLQVGCVGYSSGGGQGVCDIVLSAGQASRSPGTSCLEGARY